MSANIRRQNNLFKPQIFCIKEAPYVIHANSFQTHLRLIDYAMGDRKLCVSNFGYKGANTWSHKHFYNKTNMQRTPNYKSNFIIEFYLSIKKKWGMRNLSLFIMERIMILRFIPNYGLREQQLPILFVSETKQTKKASAALNNCSLQVQSYS